MRIGTVLILLTSLCWATDSIFRYRIVENFSLDPLTLVFFEHTLLTLVTFWVMIYKKEQFGKLGPKGWFSSMLTGLGGSALALYVFTLSFKYINPSVSIVLQKLHPVFAICLAVVILREKITRHLMLWGGLAMFSGLILSSSEILKIMESARSDSLASDPTAGLFGISLALIAAVLWGTSTAASRYMAINHGFSFSMAIRFAMGFLGLLLIILLGPGIQGIEFELTQLKTQNSLPSLLYLVFVSGLFAMSLYYYGLKTTKAQVATFIESLWPVLAAFLNWAVFGFSMNVTQILFAFILLFAVYKVQNPPLFSSESKKIT